MTRNPDFKIVICVRIPSRRWTVIAELDVMIHTMCQLWN